MDDVDDVVVVDEDDDAADVVVIEFELVTLASLIVVGAVFETTTMVLVFTVFNTFFASSTGVTSTSLMASGLLATSP